MRANRRMIFALGAMGLALQVGCGDDGSSVTGGSGGDGGTGGAAGVGGGPAPSAYAANVCVGAKQRALGDYCSTTLEAWAAWASDQNDAARDEAIANAADALEQSWVAAQGDAEAEGADCADLAWPASAAATTLDANTESIATSITDGLDLGVAEQSACASALLGAAAETCQGVLEAEAAHVSNLAGDPDGAALDAATESAREDFSGAWDQAVSGSCPTNATEETVLADLDALRSEAVGNTIVAPGLDAAAFTTLEPGETEYLGRSYEPQCMQGDPYRYFAKRGTVNKLVMYYQGGGACWNNLTCNVPTCRVSPPGNLDGNDSGFGDLDNPDNPFRDWHWVFVSYCTCDIHFGDATQDYVGFEDITVQHKGYHNARVAERWAREHFLNPEVVFVTGSSAGAYGAWFNAPLHHDVWPASQIHVLADAGNGVITQEFLQEEFSNWDFVANLPDIPGVLESITEGNGMEGYTEAVAEYFPDTNWAHYSTAYDGSQGGQTGFYNIMLNDGNPLAGATWWEASCQWGDNAVQQSLGISETVSSNYRYYFGTGSRHTMWGADKVYDDTTGGVPTVVSWIEGMLASGPGGRDPAWENVSCENCGLLLDGDPRPDPLQAPFEAQGDDVVIVCE